MVDPTNPPATPPVNVMERPKRRVCCCDTMIAIYVIGILYFIALAFHVITGVSDVASGTSGSFLLEITAFFFVGLPRVICFVIIALKKFPQHLSKIMGIVHIVTLVLFILNQFVSLGLFWFFASMPKDDSEKGGSGEELEKPREGKDAVMFGLLVTFVSMTYLVIVVVVNIWMWLVWKEHHKYGNVTSAKNAAPQHAVAAPAQGGKNDAGNSLN